MAGNVIARRYAKALFLEAKAEGLVEKVTVELAEFVNAAVQTDLLSFLSSPQSAIESKQRVLAEISSGSSSLFGRFMELLLKKRRFKEVSAIYDSLLELEDEERGIERAKVTTAVPMTDDQVEKLKSELKRLMGKEIILEAKVKDSIIAGVVVEMGDYLIDGSLKKEIRDIRDRLRHARVS